VTDSSMTADDKPLSGLELFQLAMARDDDADKPPSIGGLIGMRATRVEFGEIDFTLTTRPDMSNPLGTVHGGIASTLLDSAMSCAVHTTLEPGAWYTTLELKVNFVRAVGTDGQVLTATGKTIHVGRTTATAEGRVHTADGRLIAHGTTTCTIRRA